jgi:hypothetical protein
VATIGIPIANHVPLQPLPRSTIIKQINSQEPAFYRDNEYLHLRATRNALFVMKIIPDGRREKSLRLFSGALNLTLGLIMINTALENHSAQETALAGFYGLSAYLNIFTQIGMPKDAEDRTLLWIFQTAE